MRVFKAVLVCYLLGYVLTSITADTVRLDVRGGDNNYDGSEIWIGVFDEKFAPSLDAISWIRQDSREFSVSVPTDYDKLTVVFLKKNCVPVLTSITPELLESGLDLECDSGHSIVGTVASNTGDQNVEGRVSIDRLHDVTFSSPDPELTSWKIEDDGSYEIQGLLPNLTYELSVVAPDFMPVFRTTTFSEDDLKQHINFELAKATYIEGGIVDRFGTPVRGEFEIVVTPIQRQTTEFEVTFDDEDNFRIGPFAEGVSVNLKASDDLDRRTKEVEVQAPSDDLQMQMLRWVTIKGTVQNQDTGEPVEEFSVSSFQDSFQGIWIPVTDPNGYFDVEVDELAYHILISAEDYSVWESSGSIKFEELDAYNFGVVQLKPAYTIRGRVFDSATLLPLAGAELRRVTPRQGHRSYWVFNNIKATTDTNGAFELSGLSLDGDELWVAAGQLGYQITAVPLTDAETELEIALDPQNGSVSGQVVSQNGHPIYPAWISGGGSYQRNEKDGSFSLRYLSGRIQLQALGRGVQSEVQEFMVENNQHITGVKLVLNDEGLGRIHGQVKGLADGEHAKIFIPSVAEARVESDGTYEALGIPMGEYEVVCTVYGGNITSGRAKRVTTTVDETLETRVDFAFAEESSVSGRLTLAGDPAGGLEVVATPTNEHQVRGYTTTFGDGTYVIEGLSDGEYDVLVTSRGVSQQVTISGHTNLDIDLGSNELSGHIQGPVSLNGLRVYLTGSGNAGRFQLSATVDNSGFYRFRGIAPGSYEVIVDHEKIDREARTVEVTNSVNNFDFFVVPSTR